MRTFSLNFFAGFLPAGILGLFCAPPASCAASQVVVWGDNTFNQTNVPPNLTNVLAIAGGGNHGLALNGDGTVTGWGDNSAGQTNAPVDLTNAVAIAAGGYHSLALKPDGTLIAWGAGMTNGGSLPDFGQGLVPPDLTNAVAIAAGQYHSLALSAEGTVTAWGDNRSHQTDVPASLSNVVAIAAGDSHCLALEANGTIAAWGDNTSQQTNVPASLNSVVAIAAGGSHSLALKSDGRIVAWGSQTNVPPGLTIPNAAIISVNDGTTSTSVSRSIAQQGNVVFNSTVGSLLVVDGGSGYSVLANGRVNYDAYVTASPGSISMTNGNTATEIPDFTAEGSTDRLFDVNRFIAVADLTPAGAARSGNNHFTNLPNFMAKARLSAPANPLEGVIVVNIKKSEMSAGISPQYVTNGINIRGTLVFNFASDVGPWDKLINTATMNINPANLSHLVVANPATYTTGYPPVYADPSKNPANIDITSEGFANFTSAEDLPALMYNISILDIHGNANICGTVFSPSFMEIANKADGQIQYFKGSLIGGGGVYVENLSGSRSIISSSAKPMAVATRSSHNLALKADGKVIAWGSQTDVPAGLTNVVVIAAGVSHSLALVGNGPPLLQASLDPSWSANGFSLTLPTQSGRVYALEYKNSLADSNWTALPLAAGNGGMKTLTDPTASGSQRFYRIRQW